MRGLRARSSAQLGDGLEAELVLSPANLGYTGGMNLGLARLPASLQGDNICFRVENGIPDTIPVIEGAISSKKEKGIGLENLQRRLELLYPGRHQFLAEKKDDLFVAELMLQYK